MDEWASIARLTPTSHISTCPALASTTTQSEWQLPVTTASTAVNEQERLETSDCACDGHRLSFPILYNAGQDCLRHLTCFLAPETAMLAF